MPYGGIQFLVISDLGQILTGDHDLKKKSTFPSEFPIFFKSVWLRRLFNMY